MDAPPEGPRLRSLGGSPSPPELADDLQLLAGFPPAGLDALWSVLGPCLTDPIPQRMDAVLDAFAETHRLDGAALARSIRGCRALVRGAALLDLDGAALAEDTRKLTSPGSPVADVLLRGYGAAKAQIREVAMRAALADHGRTLEGVDWRLDQVVSSSAGGRLRFPAVVVTLRCRDHGREEPFTFQATPERLRELQAMCTSILGPAGGKA